MSTLQKINAKSLWSSPEAYRNTATVRFNRWIVKKVLMRRLKHDHPRKYDFYSKLNDTCQDQLDLWEKKVTYDEFKKREFVRNYKNPFTEKRS